MLGVWRYMLTFIVFSFQLEIYRRKHQLDICARVGHSYMYLITHLRWKGIYHGAIYLRNWNSLHPISTNKSKFCHFR